jgi:hypothetical protein
MQLFVCRTKRWLRTSLVYTLCRLHFEVNLFIIVSQRVLIKCGIGANSRSPSAAQSSGTPSQLQRSCVSSPNAPRSEHICPNVTHVKSSPTTALQAPRHVPPPSTSLLFKSKSAEEK